MHSLHQRALGARVPTGVAWLLMLGACSGSSGVPERPTPPGLSGVDPSQADLGSAVATGGGVAGTAGVGGTMAGPGASPGGSVAPAPDPVVGARCVTKAVSASPMRRLTHREYANAVRDLLGAKSDPSTGFANDTQKDLFDTMATQSVSVLLADQYLDAATHLAEGVTDLKTLIGCDPASATSTTCVRDFTKRFTRRAYRRPATTDELTRLNTLYDTTRTNSDGPTGVRAVLAAVLASPHFLFRPEFGAGTSNLPKALKSAPFELSARLSFLLWGSVPDDALLDAAAAGQLATPEQLATQTKRMLADARAHNGVLGFYEQWLGLELLATTTKDAAVYPAFNEGLRDAMLEETRRFVDHVLFQEDAKLGTLLTAPYSFVNAPLAKLYGVKGPADAATFSKVSFDPAQRSGVLTQASIMAAFASASSSSPVKRGRWVRTRLLCQDLPEPPANVPPLPPPKQGVSTRERFAMHTASPACSGCHSLIDGLGFGLERYDGIGALRSMDLGVAVDARGEITATMDIDGDYDGGPELATLLAGSDQVHNCAPTQWLRYSLGRRETGDDTCSLAALQDGFRAQKGDLKQLLVALTQSDAFVNYRKPD